MPHSNEPPVPAPQFSSKPCEVPPGLRPHKRQTVTLGGFDTFVEALQVNSFERHSHGKWQIVIAFFPAFCRVTVWDGDGNSRELNLSGGQVWLLPPHLHHAAHWENPAEVVVLFVEPEIAGPFLTGFKPDVPILPLSSYIAEEPEIAYVCKRIRRYADVPNGSTDARVACAGADLACTLLDAHARLTQRVIAPNAEVLAKVVNALTQFIANDQSGRLPVAKIARAAGLSARHFRRVFERAMGESPQAWAGLKRAEKAVELLLKGASIKDAADKAGYSDPSHMNRKLSEYFQATASHFRLAYRRSSQSGKPGTVKKASS